jgi:hypothetical protein
LESTFLNKCEDKWLTEKLQFLSSRLETKDDTAFNFDGYCIEGGIAGITEFMQNGRRSYLSSVVNYTALPDLVFVGKLLPDF